MLETSLTFPGLFLAFPLGETAEYATRLRVNHRDVSGRCTVETINLCEKPELNGKTGWAADSYRAYGRKHVYANKT